MCNILELLKNYKKEGILYIFGLFNTTQDNYVYESVVFIVFILLGKMVTSCVAFGCTNRMKKGSGISFHRLPSDSSNPFVLKIRVFVRKVME